MDGENVQEAGSMGRCVRPRQRDRYERGIPFRSDVQTDWVGAEVNGCDTMRVAYGKLKSSVR